MKKILISILIIFVCLLVYFYLNINNDREYISELEQNISEYKNSIENVKNENMTIESGNVKLQNEISKLENQVDLRSIEIDELSLKVHNLFVINEVYTKAAGLNISREAYDSSELFDTTEGSYIEILKSDDELILVNLYLFGEMGKIKESYSNLSKDIYYIEFQELKYKEPFTLNNSELVINKYFLIRNILVRVLEDGSLSESEPEEEILDRFNDHRVVIEKFIKFK